MVLELKQQLRLTQQLVMTPQLQQAIKLLQLSRLELVNLVQKELEENPVLEEAAEVEAEAAPAETPEAADARAEASNEPSAAVHCRRVFRLRDGRIDGSFEVDGLNAAELATRAQ